jgi:fatty acid desaturase
MSSTNSRIPPGDRDGVWSLHEAALHGSSHYDLPSVMCWFTANIGVHHIHHLCSRIPYYRLHSSYAITRNSASSAGLR